MSENLFGRVFDSLGSNTSDLLLKTKGQVKIQYGNKYIDLIKEGNINYPKEQIQKLINHEINLLKDNLIPSGIIFLYKGSNIPEGWVVCNGENNTPIIESEMEGVIYIMKI